MPRSRKHESTYLSGSSVEVCIGNGVLRNILPFACQDLVKGIYVCPRSRGFWGSREISYLLAYDCRLDYGCQIPGTHCLSAPFVESEEEKK